MKQLTAIEAVRQTYAEDHSESAAYVALYRARGGYDGALARQHEREQQDRPRPAVGHMPFPHKHYGEWR